MYFELEREDIDKIKEACSLTLNHYKNYMVEYNQKTITTNEDLLDLIDELNYALNEARKEIKYLENYDDVPDNTYSGGVYE